MIDLCAAQRRRLRETLMVLRLIVASGSTASRNCSITAAISLRSRSKLDRAAFQLGEIEDHIDDAEQLPRRGADLGGVFCDRSRVRLLPRSAPRSR